MTNSTDEFDKASGSNTSASLVSLKQQRSSMKRNIANMKLKVDKEGENVDSTILECRLQILESYFKQLCHIQNQIEKLDTEDINRSDIEESFIYVKAKIMSLLNSKRRTSMGDQSFLNASSSVGPAYSHRLPNLKLPKFSGKYAEYNRFINAFKSLVDNDPTVSTLDKFEYLKGCLTDQALAVIEPFQITEANYSKALDQLKARFDSKVLIFLDHINSIFDMEKMKKADPVSLRNVIDTVAALRGSLLSLGSETEVMNAIIIHIVLSKVDIDSKLAYDEKQEFTCLPSWEDCYTVLSRRCQFLESRTRKIDVTQNQPEKKRNSQVKGRSYTLLNSKALCTHCNNTEHLIGNCSTFLSLSVSQRFDFAKRSGLCLNCLRKGHTVSKCLSKSRCRVCHLAHHTILHVYTVSAQVTNPSNLLLTQEAQESTQAAATSLVSRTHKRSIIPTALILIKDKYGIFQTVRALLDSCSEINFIAEETAKRLQLRFQRNDQEVFGISDIRTEFKYAVLATVKSRLGTFECTSNFVVTKTISAQQPSEHISTKNWKIPQEIDLADPEFYKPQKIDLLMSSEMFFDLLLDGKISLGDGLPCLVNTKFGWIVGDKFDSNANPRRVISNAVLSSPQSSRLDTMLQRFWEVEEYAVQPNTFSEEELQCENHFVKNVTCNSDGRIQVRLPFKELPESLRHSFEMARRRFLSLERRLQRDHLLKNMYVDFMSEYEKLGHMSPVENQFIGVHYYIPHHCVLKPESVTTKLRVVFGENITKALGMAWKPREDTFCFRFEMPQISPSTKRSILSVVASIFDVLGVLSPIIIQCKILLQEMWIKQINWDEPLTPVLFDLWIQIRDDLIHINDLSVPRFVLTSTEYSCEIHGFADASERAYGCYLYVRKIIGSTMKTALLIAKSKVAPIKAQSVPRLELCAALLLCHTWHKIKHKLSKYITQVYFWTDSKIVLQWLKLHFSTLTCFVANRVSELQEKTKDISWRHVPTKSNPADIVSRGCSAWLLSNTIWFSGPEFLLKPSTEWPSNNDLIERLKTNAPISPSFQKLTPFLHEVTIDNKVIHIIRVGGRLSTAPIPYDAKFPVLLPNDHRFTLLFVEFLHRKHLHAGTKTRISLIRQKVWIVNARSVARKVVRNCVHCFHYKPKLMGQIMGNLPADRLKSQRPFLISGVDFCGPFFTSYRIRGKPPYKTYVAIFVCFTSKAIHTELVSELSTNAFLLCLKRFVGRRGIPQRLYCDNATNFVGAQTKLLEFQKQFFNQTMIDQVQNFSSQTGFEFCFIPPRAPHFGGLWEAAVKSTKSLLTKNVAHAYLTFEELQTVLIEVEAILNSRPLVPISDDPNDGEALTPAHLLIGSSLQAIPDEKFDIRQTSYLSRWQQVTFLKQKFWDIWSRDYILSLQQRSKWLKPEANIKVGQIVIVHEQNIPPEQWLLARITHVIPGQDGRVRVVDLKTSKGTFRRAIHKVAPLPTLENF